MRSSEVIAFVYFVVLAAASLVRPVGAARRAQITAIGIVMAAAVFAIGHHAPAVVRNWAPCVYILAGYFLSGRFFVRPSAAFEAWLAAWDRRVIGDPTRRFECWPRPLLAYLEVVYLGCFLLVPAGFALLAATGRAALADRYWTMLVAAEFGSFGPLAFVQARPPWLVERPPSLPDRGLHDVAAALVSRFTIRANTFPSGHVAGSLAVALALAAAAPAAAALFFALALSIGVACIVGRYHYVVDVVAGAALALAIWAVVSFTHPMSETPKPSPSAALSRLLASPSPIVLAGAHNPLSARLVAEAGFDGVWASGFEISAAYGVPDASILTMTETLEASRLMAEAVDIPVVADCDTAFGNAINAIRTVRAFEAAGVAGISIEDNVFPKRCSFYPGVKRLLVDLDEQTLKIRAAVDAGSRDFVVIARTEALIAGWGLEGALRRGRAYADAGADAILIHSNQSTLDDVARFAEEWDRLTPLVCVPTTYASATVDELSRRGFKMIIFANHALRSAIRAMQETLRTLREAGHASAVDDRIVPLGEVYRLVGLGQLKADEREYLPADSESVKAVILAAGFDRRLMPLISDKPKAMLDVKGKSILERQIDALQQSGVRQIAVVRGYKKEQVTLPNVRYYDNDAFEESGELESLLRAGAELSGAVVVMYGDILFDRNILERLLQSPDDITLVCDRSWPDTRAGRESSGCDLVVESPTPRRHHRFLADAQPVSVTGIGTLLDPATATAEFIGMAKLSARGCQILGEVYRALRERTETSPIHESATLKTAKLTDLLHEVIARGHAVASVGIYQGWLEVDTFDDYRRAWAQEVG